MLGCARLCIMTSHDRSHVLVPSVIFPRQVSNILKPSRHTIQWNVPVVDRPTDLTIHHVWWAIQAWLRFRCSHCWWIGWSGYHSILYGLAESYRWDPVSTLNWLAKNCKRGTYSIWCRQADLEESPLSTDQPGWYLTHIVCAGQTSKKPTFNRSASHTSQWISPMVDLPADLTKSPLWTSHPMLADVQFPTEQPDIGQSPS
jgi:hypothetical protein